VDVYDDDDITISLASARGTDTDPDTAGIQVREGSTVLLLATLSHAAEGGITFHYTARIATQANEEGQADNSGTMGLGTAADADFYPRGERVPINMVHSSTRAIAGQMDADIRIEIKADRLAEDDETLTVTLTSEDFPSRLRGPFGRGNVSVDLIIVENSAAAHSLSLSGPASLDEGDAAQTYTITRNGPAIPDGTALSVIWGFQNGAGENAVAAADFTGGLPAGGTLSFSGSETSKTFTIDPAQDALAEGGAVDLVGAAPLPLLALALYAFYLAANRLADPGEAHVLSRRLDRVFSGPPLLLSLLMAALLATALLLALHTLREQGAAESLAAKFLERGVIPPLTLFLFCWGLLMILNKFFALWWERRTFAGVRPGSVLLASFQQLQNEHSAHGLDYFLDLLWKKSTDFYTLPRYINWAIPILGFIGTVLGISLAAEGIQSIIGAQGGLAQMSADLGKAISPLGIAFDTTLIALSLSVALVLIQTALQRWEDNVLIDVEHRLRVMEEAAGGASPA